MSALRAALPELHAPSARPPAPGLSRSRPAARSIVARSRRRTKPSGARRCARGPERPCRRGPRRPLRRAPRRARGGRRRWLLRAGRVTLSWPRRRSPGSARSSGSSCPSSCSSRTRRPQGSLERWSARCARDRACSRRRSRAARGDLPLSFAQERLWFLNRSSRTTPPMSSPSPFASGARSTRRRSSRALAALARRHEVLRTTFAAREGRPPNHPRGSLPALACEDLEPRRAAPEEAMRTRGRGGAQQAPSISREARCSARGSSAWADEDQVLLLSMHHIVSDAWSNGVLVAELFTLTGPSSVASPPLARAPDSIRRLRRVAARRGSVARRSSASSAIGRRPCSARRKPWISPRIDRARPCLPAVEPG
jgi:hypothetical protein